jgi:hypothetical protein
MYLSDGLVPKRHTATMSRVTKVTRVTGVSCVSCTSLMVWSPNATLCQEYQVCHVYHCSIAEKREGLKAEGCRS